MTMIEDSQLQPEVTPTVNNPPPEAVDNTTDLWRGMPPRVAFTFGLITAIAVSSTIALVFLIPAYS